MGGQLAPKENHRNPHDSTSGEASPRPSGLQWTNITYDIPSGTRKERKQAQAKALDAEKAPSPPSHPSRTDRLPPLKPGHRRLLGGISGGVGQGEYLGILGSSGAGKTTLLNVLSARLGSLGDLGGEVTYNGVSRDPTTWKRTVGYVEQDDAMLPRGTVRETVEYASKLRLPDSEFGKEDKARRVDGTLKMLRLEDCADTRIGSAVERGVSGGERKRASIATELVSDVSLLFLDEPTSGLDAFAAENLITNVAQVVRERNLACVMTIHQPSWSVFTTLDRVMLLARGGVYYDGPPKDTIPWFSSLGYDVPEGMNPADFFISITENAGESQDRIKRVEELLGKWAEHKESGGKLASYKENPVLPVPSMDSGRTVSPGNEQAIAMQEKVRTRWPTSWVKEFKILLTRTARESLRDRQTQYATIGQSVFILIIIGFGFFRLKNVQSDVLPKIGVLFFVPINSSFSVLMPVITPFPLQRALMKRERSAGLYRTSSFYLSKVLLETPLALIQRLLFYVILYFMIGLRLDAGAFFIFLGVNCVQVSNSIGQSFPLTLDVVLIPALGLAVGAVSPSIDVANILAPVITVVFLLFGGTFVPNPPPWFVWLKWISPINYTFAALVQNEFAGQPIECDTPTNGACYGSGDAVIEAYNAATFTVAENVGFMFALTALFLVLGYLGLRFTAGPRLRFK